MTAPAFAFTPGDAPLLISVPHAGTDVPPALAARMTQQGRALADTDWWVDRLYRDLARELGAGLLVAAQSRYVIDLNRPPDGTNLYPGRPTPELVPRDTFAGEPVWQTGEAPTESEVQERLAQHWMPYHEKLQATLTALKARHGFARLWDAHSIRGEVPRLFDGRLPDLSLGTGGGSSCATGLRDRLGEIAANANGYSAVLDGRFRGGYITRHYGQPATGIDAVQLELVQACYMDEAPPWTWQEERAARLRPVLRELLAAMAS
ncbi:MAG: N-formylglutamate deformylase [Planctomycetota bacterium]